MKYLKKFHETAAKHFEKAAEHHRSAAEHATMAVKRNVALHGQHEEEEVE